MSRRQLPKTKLYSTKGTDALEHAKAVNAIDPGRYRMVRKGNKTVPVYVAKLERELARRCTAENKITGERCGNAPIKGGKVCFKHGGNLPNVKNAAKELLAEARERLLSEVDPTIDRLLEIRDQDDHMPSALGAATQILHRTLGKPGESEDNKGARSLTIKVGVGIGVGIKSRKELAEPSLEGIVVERSE